MQILLFLFFFKTTLFCMDFDNFSDHQRHVGLAFTFPLRQEYLHMTELNENQYSYASGTLISQNCVATCAHSFFITEEDVKKEPIYKYYERKATKVNVFLLENQTYCETSNFVIHINHLPESGKHLPESGWSFYDLALVWCDKFDDVFFPCLYHFPFIQTNPLEKKEICMVGYKPHRLKSGQMALIPHRAMGETVEMEEVVDIPKNEKHLYKNCLFYKHHTKLDVITTKGFSGTVVYDNKQNPKEAVFDFLAIHIAGNQIRKAWYEKIFCTYEQFNQHFGMGIKINTDVYDFIDTENTLFHKKNIFEQLSPIPNPDICAPSYHSVLLSIIVDQDHHYISKFLALLSKKLKPKHLTDYVDYVILSGQKSAFIHEYHLKTYPAEDIFDADQMPIKKDIEEKTELFCSPKSLDLTFDGITKLIDRYPGNPIYVITLGVGQNSVDEHEKIIDELRNDINDITYFRPKYIPPRDGETMVENMTEIHKETSVIANILEMNINSKNQAHMNSKSYQDDLSSPTANA